MTGIVFINDGSVTTKESVKEIMTKIKKSKWINIDNDSFENFMINSDNIVAIEEKKDEKAS